MIKISYIIPVYNSSKSLDEAIDSIIKVSGKGIFEIIIVDDNSDQSLEELINKHKNKSNLKFYRLNKNLGPGGARNYGLFKSSGQYIHFLDCDDVIIKKINMDSENIISSKPDIIAFNSKYNIEKSKSIRSDLECFKQKNKKILIKKYLNNEIDPSVIFYYFKREFLIKNTITFENGFHEDICFTFEALLKMNSWVALEDDYYLKKNRIGSIINTLSVKHIDGYFRSLNKIGVLINTQDYKNEVKYFLKLVINVASSRIKRVYDQDIQKLDSSLEILKTIKKSVNDCFGLFNIEVNDYLASAKNLKTNYFRVYEKFNGFDIKKDEMISFSNFFHENKNKSWSCYDLHNSVFLAPDEVRTCCKRFFYQGILKGDVRINSIESGRNVTYEDIVKNKENLYGEINKDNPTECKGCPFLEYKDWSKKPLDEGIKYLSLEYHSVCNMKCTYCSDVYYGGEKAKYDTKGLIDSLIDNSALNDADYIVWGGGEPLIDKNFETLSRKILANTPKVKQRIITNATIYREYVQQLIDNDEAYIVTSIDAGSAKTFDEIRKYKNINKIYKNLVKYSASKPHNVIIKYIIMDENRSKDELDKYIENIKKYKLHDCNFQISCNFKTNILGIEQMISVCYLYTKLLSEGVSFIFNDDLIWQRIKDISIEQKNIIVDFLKKHNLDCFIANSNSTKNLMLWGAGAQSKLLRKKTLFLKDVNVKFIIDPKVKGPKKENDIDIFGVNKATENNLPILIAAVQSAPQIYKQILDIGINENRIIKELII